MLICDTLKLGNLKVKLNKEGLLIQFSPVRFLYTTTNV